jgi:large subunit ribosomal protein L29
MKASEIRELPIEDIEERLGDAREELMNLRFQLATGELTDFNRISSLRRDIARFMTILKEMQDDQGTNLEGEA